MRSARDLFLPGLVCADGAMGTYYAQSVPDKASSCEEANISHPSIIRDIHRSYLKAGARFLRSNTFAVMALARSQSRQVLQELMRSGFEQALACAGKETFVAADFGPAYDLDPQTYLSIGRELVDTVLAQGADLFLFETFADPNDFLPLCKAIKKRSSQAVIMASFTLSADGKTRKGLALSQLAQAMEACDLIDLWGLNCGIGPTHLAQQVQTLGQTGKPLLLLPNSGYPRMENQRLVYGTEPDYFARVVSQINNKRIKLLGGCCGTTPAHIAALNRALKERSPKRSRLLVHARPAAPLEKKEKPALLADRVSQGLFTVVCEFNPPAQANMQPLLKAAGEVKKAGVDLMTLADSPMARVKMDSLAAAARIQREVGLPVLPHLCCRDRNANALRAGLLALHSEGVRQVLAVTGDPIPEADRGFIKPVFNLNSVGLLEMIRQLNDDIFSNDPLLAVAAVDPGRPNQEAEFVRCRRKQEAGAALFLTQPLFDLSALPFIRRMRSAGMRVYAGLMPLVSDRNAQYLNHEVPGIRIPQAILQQFSAEQSRQTGIETGLGIASQLARQIRTEVDGLYLVAPFNRSDLMVRLIEKNQNWLADRAKLHPVGGPGS